MIKDKANISLLPFNTVPIGDLFYKYNLWYNDVDVRKYLLPTTPKTKEQIHSWLMSVINDNSMKYFVIYLTNYEANIGHLGIKNINLHTREAEISIVIGEKHYWNSGIGKKSIEQIIPFAKSIGLKKLTAMISKYNEHSNSLFINLNFVKNKMSYREDMSTYTLKIS